MKGIHFFIAILFCTIGLTQPLLSQVVLSLTSSGQYGLSDTWTNTSNIPLKIRVTAQGGGGGKGVNQSSVYDENLQFTGYTLTSFGGGTGATMQGEFIVKPCETIFAIAGSKGGDYTLLPPFSSDFQSSGGGGGGSGIVNATTNTLLVLAAGGTGADAVSSGNGLGGSAATNGNGSGGSGGKYSTGGGGLYGNGATSIYNQCPAFGGGMVSLNSISPGGSHCLSYRNGGNGGSGMGGGGGASDLSGGGGGHTGGNGGTLNRATLGIYSSASSFNIGTNQVNTNGLNNAAPNDGTVVIELLESPLLSLDIISSHSNVACNGLNNGTITLIGSGGLKPYSFELVGVSTNTTGQFTGLSAGTYTYIVKDAGCLPFTNTNTITIKEPTAITVSSSNTAVKCNGGNDGTATISANGGTPNYSFKLGTTTNTTGLFTGLITGTYAYTVTDANTCSKTGSVIVGQPTPLSISASKIDVKCNGSNDGTATLTANGGTPNYSFKLGTTTNATGLFTGLIAGTYAFTVTDANTCSKTGSVVIGQPTPLSISASKTDVKCNGGSDGTATLTASGGTPNYSFKLGTTTNATGLFTGLIAGTYAYTVTDANTCSKTGSVVIGQPTPISATSTAGSIACNGGTTTVIVSATDGTAPYTGTGSFTRGAGTYSFTVTDGNGCTKTTSVTISQPTVLVATSSAGTIACNGGTTTVTVSASGGTAPYTGIGTFTKSVGTYSFTVTDANGCTKTTSVTISQPTILVVTSSAGTIACNGGTTTVIVSATDGTAPYTGTGSFIKGAGTHTFTVTDANGCTKTTSVTISQPTVLVATFSAGTIACNGGTTTVIVSASGGTAPYSGIGSFTKGVGTYSFTVTDANGCSQTTSATISEPTILVATSSARTIACNGGTTTVTVSASGGTAPYTGIGTFTKSVGTYSFTVTDANGCKTSTSMTITEPPKIVITQFSPTNSTQCVGSMVTYNAAATGVNMAVKWQKNNSDITLPVPYISSTIATYITPPSTASDNGATYRAVFQDGCPNDLIATANGTITINTPSVGGTLSPAQSQGCGPTPVSLSVTGINGRVTQWERQTDCKGAWASIGSPDLQAIMTTTPNSSTCYRVAITNGVCPTAYSTVSTITVDKPAVGGKVTLQSNQTATSVALCSGQNALIIPKDYAGKVANWQFNVNTSPVWVDLPGSENAQTLTVSGSTVPITIFYRVVIVTELGLCTGQSSVAYSSAFRITKKPGCSSPDGSIVNTDEQTKQHLTIQKAYPNPTSDFVTLEIESHTEGVAQLEIEDITGRQVLKQTATLTEGMNSINLDISQLSSGVFIVKMTDSKNQKAMVKVVKE